MKKKHGDRSLNSSKEYSLPFNIYTIIEDPELTTDVDEDKNLKFVEKFTPGHKLHAIISLLSSSNLITLFIAPQMLSIGGLCLSLAIIFFFYASFYYSNYIFLKLILHKTSSSYPELISNFKGKKLYIVYIITYFLYMFGILLIYVYFSFIFISESYISVLIQNLLPNSQLTQDVSHKIVYISTIVSLMFVIQFMFSFCKSYDKISLISKIILIILAIIGFIMILDALIEHLDITVNNFIYKELQFGDSLIFAIFALGMCNHLTICKELKHLSIVSKPRYNYIAQTTLLVQFITLFIFGFIGALSKKSKYLVWIFKNQSSILTRSINCILGVVFTIHSSFHAIKLNDSLATMNKFHTTTLNKIRYFFIIIVLLLIDGLLILLQYFIGGKTLYIIIVFIGLLGGVCIAIISFAIPLYLYNKHVNIIEIPNEEHKKWNKIIILVMMLIGILVTILSCFVKQEQFLP